MPDASGGLFSGLYWIFRGKLPMEDLAEGDALKGTPEGDAQRGVKGAGGDDWRNNPGKRPAGYPGKHRGRGPEGTYESMDATSPGQYSSHALLGDHYIDNNGKHYYGKAAQYAYQEENGGPPTDGVTGEPGYFGDWAPSNGDPYGQQEESDRQWGG